MSAPSSLRLVSPSKINLHLRVAAPGAGGFHPLRSWMVTTGLHDTIRLDRGPRDDGSLALTCDDATLACDDTNLIARAARALIEPPRDADGRAPGVTIHLAKRIPRGAGLGGGSGNAATTLAGLNDLLRLDRSHAQLHALATALGSDVPFFLGPPSAIATGRGEVLEACPAPAHARVALLILPPYGVATAAAYRALDAVRPVAPPDVLEPFGAVAWARLPATVLLERLVNDLEVAAFAIEPRLADLRDAAQRRLGRRVRMSGSGSALFTLYDDRDAAEAGAANVRGIGPLNAEVVTLAPAA